MSELTPEEEQIGEETAAIEAQPSPYDDPDWDGRQEVPVTDEEEGE